MRSRNSGDAERLNSDAPMHCVRLDGECLRVADGTLLSQLLLQAGKYVEHPCGGNGRCGKCKVFVDGKAVLSCKYRIEKDVTVFTPAFREMRTVSGLQESRAPTAQMCYALDVGTTTIALALVSLEEKKVVRVLTETNAQRAFGADVISRIQYCVEHGQETLHRVLVEQIERMVEQLHVSNPLPMLVAANVTMLHLLFDEDCRGMGTAPYTPVFLNSRVASVAIKGVSRLQCLPSVHAFVGADVVAGMHAVGLPEPGKFRLLVDLGTNAEIVLFSRHGGLCTSAAAGPCFEGVHISCGMSATEGAISKVWQAGGRLMLQTVGNVTPKGICGTGLVDAVAALLRMGRIDKTGLLDGAREPLTKEIFLSAEDVRQFQLAKSAVSSAIAVLMEEAGITCDALDGLFLSGGFSTEMNISNAVTVGLFPRALLGKCRAIPNSSLAGCVQGLLSQTDFSEYTAGMRYVELAKSARFEKLFVENMMFS